MIGGLDRSAEHSLETRRRASATCRKNMVLYPDLSVDALLEFGRARAREIDSADDARSESEYSLDPPAG